MLAECFSVHMELQDDDLSLAEACVEVKPASVITDFKCQRKLYRSLN